MNGDRISFNHTGLREYFMFDMIGREAVFLLYAPPRMTTVLVGVM